MSNEKMFSCENKFEQLSWRPVAFVIDGHRRQLHVSRFDAWSAIVKRCRGWQLPSVLRCRSFLCLTASTRQVSCSSVVDL